MLPTVVRLFPLILILGLVVWGALACSRQTCPSDLVEALRDAPSTVSEHSFHADAPGERPLQATIRALGMHLRSGIVERCYFDGDDATVHVRFPDRLLVRESFRRSLRGRIDRRIEEPGERWILHAVQRGGDTWFLDWTVPSPQDSPVR